MVACLTVDDSQMNILSQVNISVIQFFEFEGKLLGPLQQPKSEFKFFTLLWRSLLSYLFVGKCDYINETKVMMLLSKTETWVIRSRSK